MEVAAVMSEMDRIIKAIAQRYQSLASYSDRGTLRYRSLGDPGESDRIQRVMTFLTLWEAGGSIRFSGVDRPFLGLDFDPATSFSLWGSPAKGYHVQHSDGELDRFNAIADALESLGAFDWGVGAYVPALLTGSPSALRARSRTTGLSLSSIASRAIVNGESCVTLQLGTDMDGGAQVWISDRSGLIVKVRELDQLGAGEDGSYQGGGMELGHNQSRGAHKDDRFLMRGVAFTSIWHCYGELPAGPLT